MRVIFLSACLRVVVVIGPSNVNGSYIVGEAQKLISAAAFIWIGAGQVEKFEIWGASWNEIDDLFT